MRKTKEIPSDSPVYQVIPVPVEKVRANLYNPNHVAPPEMKLLELSIWEDGFTQPVVCYYKSDQDIYEIVDGFHRYLIIQKSSRVYQRERGMLPVSVIDKNINHRIASTIRHNRAKGSHSIDRIKSIVADLTRAGKSDQWILKNIGMDADELLRMKQISGLASLFTETQFSQAWVQSEEEIDFYAASDSS